MKAVLRIGVLAALFVAGLAVFSPGGGIRGPESVEAAPPNVLIIRVEDPNPANDHQFSIDRPAPCTDDQAPTLSGGEFTSIPCGTDGIWIITVTPAPGTVWTVNDCPIQVDTGINPGKQSSVVSRLGNVLTLDIVEDEDIACTFTFAAAARTLELVADPGTISCGGTSDLTAIVREAGVAVPGLTYTFTTDSGELSDTPADGTATLTLAPGDGDATVTVSEPSVAEPETLVIEN